MHVHLTFIALGRSEFKAILSEDNTPVQTKETILTTSSKTPLLSAARKLKALGYLDETKITASHEGSDTIALASTVGNASRLSLSERDREPMRYEPYKPHPNHSNTKVTVHAA